jgi:hypothetical protein
MHNGNYTSEQASKQAQGSHVCLLANLEDSAWPALAWLLKSGVAACLLEARLISVYAYTEVLHSVEFVVSCTETVIPYKISISLSVIVDFSAAWLSLKPALLPLLTVKRNSLG